MHDSHFGHTNGNHRQQQVEENGSIMNQFTSSSLPPSLAAALLPQTVGHAFEQQQNIPQRDPQRQNSTVVPAVLPQQSSASPPTSGNYTFVDVQKEGGGIKYNAACAECRKAHKQCSKTFPCTRCVKLGLGDTCTQAERKRRLPSKRKWYQVQGDGSAVLIQEEPSMSSTSSTSSSTSSSSSDLTNTNNVRTSPQKKGLKKPQIQQPQQQQPQQDFYQTSDQQFVLYPPQHAQQQGFSFPNPLPANLTPLIHELQGNSHHFASHPTPQPTPPIQAGSSLSLSNYSLQQNPVHLKHSQQHQYQHPNLLKAQETPSHQHNQFINSASTLLRQPSNTSPHHLFQQQTLSHMNGSDRQHLYQYLEEQQRNANHDFVPSAREFNNL